MELIGIKRRNIVKYFSVSGIRFVNNLRPTGCTPDLTLIILQRSKLWKYIVDLVDHRETVDIVFWSEDHKFNCFNCYVTSFSNALDKDNWPDCHGEATIHGLKYTISSFDPGKPRFIKKAMMYAINEFLIPEKRQKLKIINH